MKEGEQVAVKVIAENRKARFDYELIDSFEAGLVLLGWEVKSLRDGGINLRDSYIREQNGELFLVGCHIAPYKFGRRDEMVETRDRKLLLTKKEIGRLIQAITQKGLSMIPTKIYFKGARIKLAFATGRGKKLYDKREDIKKRDSQRAIARSLSGD